MLQRERLRVFGDSGSRLVGLRGNVGLARLWSAATYYIGETLSM